VNILVTGAAGYIGSVCAEVLVSRGMSVIALDSLLEGHRAAVPPGAIFCQADLANRPQIEAVFSQHKIDAVMHFAAEALVAKSVSEPSIFYATNVAGGVNLLDAVTRHGVKKFIFSSTAATYGEPEIVPIPEDHRKAPIDAASGGLPHVDVFGTDYPTPDGTCVRDYIHVLDIADSHVRALEEIDRVSGEAFNVGNSRGFSILEVIDAAERITGRKIPRKLGPRRPGDPAVLVASKEKLKRMLGWEAAHSSLEEIIQSAWAWKLKHPHGYADSATA
jgi:UDP-glucose 4-epimerase